MTFNNMTGFIPINPLPTQKSPERCRHIIILMVSRKKRRALNVTQRYLQ